MDRVRPCRSESVSAFEFVIPMFDSRRFRAHEILEVNGLPSGPPPCGPRKSGMPLAVEIPAPVKIKARREARR